MEVPIRDIDTFDDQSSGPLVKAFWVVFKVSSLFRRVEVQTIESGEASQRGFGKHISARWLVNTYYVGPGLSLFLVVLTHNLSIFMDYS